MYDYIVPPGMGDTFFQYVFDAQGAGLADSTDVFQKGVLVADGQFVLRQWAGLRSLAERIQIYDWLNRRFASEAMFLGAGALGQGSYQNGYGGMVVAPEVIYPDQGAIRFDLTNVTQDVAGVDGALTVYRSQVVYSGVRRREGVISDPAPSKYPYYEKRFSIPYTLSINNYASSGGILLPGVQKSIEVRDFDFELRRIELAPQSAGQESQFKILLYDRNWVAMSNLPVLSNLLLHTPELALTDTTGDHSWSFWPSPPILYPVNSVIRFDIFSLLFAPTALPQTFQLLFDGVRRIPCS